VKVNKENPQEEQGGGEESGREFNDHKIQLALGKPVANARHRYRYKYRSSYRYRCRFTLECSRDCVNFRQCYVLSFCDIIKYVRFDLFLAACAFSTPTP